MIPLRSSERTYSFPVVTLLLIVVNVLVFLFELSLPEYPPYVRTRGLTLNTFIAQFGIVPDRFQPFTLLTSMFLHGGFLHIAGNMWFLWIFGKGIEDLIGHGRYLVLYIVCGLIAGYVQVITNPNSPVPTIGASGAIAGVMGAYLVKFPRARILTLVPIVIFITTFDLPAAVLLLYWFGIQFFSGIGSVGYSSVSKGDIAWFAHVGGFVAGMLFVSLIHTRQQRYRDYYS